jgi:hypothetical protein
MAGIQRFSLGPVDIPVFLFEIGGQGLGPVSKDVGLFVGMLILEGSNEL